MTTGPQSLVCLTTSAATGGAETSLLTLLAAFGRLEPSWAITVIAPSSGPLLDRCRQLGIAGMTLPYPAALSSLGESGATGVRRRSVNQMTLLGHSARAAVTLPRYVTALRRALLDVKATVVHSNGLKGHITGALAKPGGTRLVWHLHEYVRGRPLTARLLRALAGRADALVTNSDSVLDDASAAVGRSAHLRRIYNAVDLSAFSPDGPRLDLAALAGLGPDDGLVRVGLVATFGRWKGHDVFIDAIARLRECAGLRAYVIGDAVYSTAGSQWSQAELRGRVAARGLDDLIGFTGLVSDVPAALRSLDILVHASTQPEPFGMVIAEGMASARAVVAVRAGGAAELFDDRVNAVGCAPGNASELADRIRELVLDPALRATLGINARRAASERFSSDRMAEEFREVYRG
ncbi:MAG: glycosyltransferase family 4 protein [Vicinamibacterales bacterium]